MRRVTMVSILLVGAISAIVAPGERVEAAPAASGPTGLNPGLVQAEQVPGTIVDVSAGSVLYLGRSAATLTVRDRNTGTDTIVPSAAGTHDEYGSLTPRGVVFTASTAEPDTRHLYEWSGGSGLVDLGPTNTYGNPVVRGSFVSWGNLGTIFRRDLGTDTTVRVADDAVDRADDLRDTGDVLYWATDNGVQGKFEVMLYHAGTTTLVTRDPTMSDLFPVTDGANVVYSKTSVVGNSGHSTWMFDETTHTDTQLSDPLFSNIDETGNYDIAQGWAAFTRPGQPVPQVWLRSPGGVIGSVSDLGRSQPGGEARIIGVSPTGETVYAVGETLYLGVVDQPPVTLATGLGAWALHRLGTPSNFVVFLDGEWNLAVGGTLYRLSDKPPTALTIRVQGKGTVTVRPYGDTCRSVCTLSVATGSPVTLAATADQPGWRPAGWSGACSGPGDTCDLDLSSAVSVTARFDSADTTAPIASSPVTTVPVGVRLSATRPAVPLATSWMAFDPDDSVAGNELQVSRNGGAFRPVPLAAPTAQSVRTTAPATSRYQFRARATDAGANLGEWTAGSPFTVDEFAPTALSYAGRWSFTSPPASWRGTAASAVDPSATATLTVEGQAVAIVARTDVNLGAFAVSVDGQLRQVVPTAYAGTSSPRVVAVLTLGGGTHTITMARAASSTGPVELQGIVVLR